MNALLSRKELFDWAENYGLYIYTYSPGDGVTRYRFSHDKDSAYFACHFIYTALGLSDACIFVLGYRSGKIDSK